MTDIVKIYNPANSAALTPEQLSDLQKLNSEQIKELAKAYPNGSQAYLLIIDTASRIKNPLPTKSSFQNLWNLRERNGMRNFVAFNFVGNYKASPAPNVKVKRSEVLDLSDTELLTLPGFKTKTETFEQVTVPVTKVKRAKKDKTNP